MRTASQINETIGEYRDELDAIVAVSEREEREMSPEETVRVTDLAEKLIPNCQAQLKTAIKVEHERNQRASARIDAEIADQQKERGEIVAREASNYRFSAIKVPAKAKMHSELKAFKGEDAERNAYIAGNVILAKVFGNSAAIHFCRNHGLLDVSAAMSTSDNSKGGFMVPEEMQTAMIRLREERGVFPQFANRVPMGADIIRVPRLLTDVVAYWVGEANSSNTGEITASDPVIGEAELMARKLAALTRISSELDEDAVIDIGDMLTMSMAYSMADKIDDAAFNGDGTSTYGGILGLKNALASGAIQDALAGNVGASTLDFADFEAALGLYPQYAAASPRWFMHSAVYYASAYRLMNAAGGNSNVTLSNGVMQPMFLGYPVSFVQVMPSTSGTLISTILAYFGDLRLSSSYGTRRSVRTEIATERYFEFDQIGVKTTERIAINNHERGETIRNRPIIALKSAAS